MVVLLPLTSETNGALIRSVCGKTMFEDDDDGEVQAAEESVNSSCDLGNYLYGVRESE
jgi:hypothetical protein